jgi:hypothetical protein
VDAEGMKVSELATAEGIIRAHVDVIRSRWHEVFGF